MRCTFAHEPQRSQPARYRPPTLILFSPTSPHRLYVVDRFFDHAPKSSPAIFLGCECVGDGLKVRALYVESHGPPAGAPHILLRHGVQPNCQLSGRRSGTLAVDQLVEGVPANKIPIPRKCAGERNQEVARDFESAAATKGLRDSFWCHLIRLWEEDRGAHVENS